VLPDAASLTAWLFTARLLAEACREGTAELPVTAEALRANSAFGDGGLEELFDLDLIELVREPKLSKVWWAPDRVAPDRGVTLVEADGDLISLRPEDGDLGGDPGWLIFLLGKFYESNYFFLFLFK